MLTSQAVTAPEAKAMATKSSPRPRKAMPANESSSRLSVTARRLASSLIHAPTSAEPSGIAQAVSTTDVA